jgi:hypothetical protein
MTVTDRNALIEAVARKTLFPNGITDREWFLYKFKPHYMDMFKCMEAVYKELNKDCAQSNSPLKEVR